MKTAVLGTGNMGSALIRGMDAALGDTVDIRAWDARPEAMNGLPARVRRAAPGTWFGSGADPDVVLVAVKPADVAAALQEFKGAKPADVLWVSIAAGVRIAAYEQILGAGARVCRVMPNTPAMIGKGASGFALNKSCTARDEKTVRSILESVGMAVRVEEKLLNAVTGLSGSGPAYVYLFIEALIEGGVAAGLPYQSARDLAVQTVAGAAAMVAQTGETPASLRAAVMSPGGTTVRGLMALEKSGMKFGVIQAVADATKRAEELGA